MPVNADFQQIRVQNAGHVKDDHQRERRREQPRMPPQIGREAFQQREIKHFVRPRGFVVALLFFDMPAFTHSLHCQAPPPFAAFWRAGRKSRSAPPIPRARRAR